MRPCVMKSQGGSQCLYRSVDAPRNPGGWERGRMDLMLGLPKKEWT